MADRIDAEVDRLRELLVEAVEANRYSAKALERKLGMAGGSTGKILRGQITLSVRHLLAILDAIDLPWEMFFQVAYPQPGEWVPSLQAPPKLPKNASITTSPYPTPPPTEDSLTELDRRALSLMRLLVQLVEEEEDAEQGSKAG
jgi:hypothetical protein